MRTIIVIALVAVSNARNVEVDNDPSLQETAGEVLAALLYNYAPSQKMPTRKFKKMGMTGCSKKTAKASL